MYSLLPWSAVTQSSPPAATTAGRIAPMHPSTVSIARTAASTTPVCPTMSAFAKLMTSSSSVPSASACTTASRMPAALISGAWS